MSATANFEHLLAQSAIALKVPGFSKKGPSFYSREGANWKVINFQKSQATSRSEVLFAVNFGIVSSRLLAFFHPSRTNTARPQQADCQWRARLDPVPDGGDGWWRLREGTDVAALSGDILRLLDAQALPALQTVVYDDALRDLWLQGHSPSLTRQDRLKYLVVLLHDLGPRDLMPVVLDQLRTLSGSTARYLEMRLGVGQDVGRA